MTEVRMTEDQLTKFEGLVGGAREGEQARFQTAVASRNGSAVARVSSAASVVSFVDVVRELHDAEKALWIARLRLAASAETATVREAGHRMDLARGALNGARTRALKEKRAELSAANHAERVASDRCDALTNEITKLEVQS